ncbi:MAG: hypothetical protein ACJATT_005057 [Myxococcota bacterium]|jgi:hypothetical protein
MAGVSAAWNPFRRRSVVWNRGEWVVLIEASGFGTHEGKAATGRAANDGKPITESLATQTSSNVGGTGSAK